MRITIITTALFTLLNTAHAQTTVKLELRMLTTTSAARPVFGANATIDHVLAAKFKAWAWLQVEEGWAEGYGGIAFAPVAWFELGLAAGVEQDGKPWRVGAFVWMGNKHVSFLALAEEGGSGLWYQATLLAKPLSWLQVGAMIKRFVGLGYRLDLSLPTGPKIKLWAAHLLYDPESNKVDPKRFLVGLSYAF